MSVKNRDCYIFVLGFSIASFLFIFSTYNAYGSDNDKLTRSVKIDSSWASRLAKPNIRSTETSFKPNLKRSVITNNDNKTNLINGFLKVKHDNQLDANASRFKTDQNNSPTSVSDVLFKTVRVFCLIMTAKANVESRAIHVNATWAKRCNKYVFITTAEGANLPNVELGIPEGREHLWSKTKAAFEYVYQNELNNFDYFLKADDDTYVVMDNLRFMLLPYNPNENLYFGCKFQMFVANGYMSGGAGYVLSREAVRRFVEVGLKNSTNCKDNPAPEEDIQMGKCMEATNATLVDTRDAEGRHRMLPYPPSKHLLPGNANDVINFGFTSYIAFDYVQGPGCCSDYMITFHYVDKAMLYVIDSFFQHFKLIGTDNTWKTEKRAGETDLDALKRFAVVRSTINKRS